MTTIYFYNEEHGHLEGEAQPRLDPLEGKELLPDANHKTRTIVPPPAQEPGKVRVFDRATQTWSQKENWVGQQVYLKANGRPQTIKLGKAHYPTWGPLPSQFTVQPRPSQWHVWDEASDSWVEDTAAIAEDARQQELRADAFLAQWEDRLRGKSLLEIKTAFDNATQAQKSELLFALVLRWAMEIK